MNDDLQVVFFSPLPWSEMQKNGFRKTSGGMFKAFWERNDIDHLYYVQNDRRWGNRLSHQIVDEKLEVIGLPIGFPYERIDIIRKINRKIQARLLSSLLPLPNIKFPLLYWFYDWWPVELVRLLPGGFKVMEVTDAVEQFSSDDKSSKNRLSSIRSQAADSVDFSIALTPTLANNIGSNGGKTEIIPNGINKQFLDLASISHVEPLEIGELQHPRLCVAGTGWSLNYRLDHELLQAVLLNLPDWQLVLVGCEYVRSKGLQQLVQSNQVTTVDLVPMERLIAYIQHCDVCAVPYLNKENREGIGGSIKTYDYLACGKPVVSSIADENEILRPYIRFAPDAQSFSVACREALNDSNGFDRSALHNLLLTMTWNTRVEKCLGMIKEINLKRREK